MNKKLILSTMLGILINPVMSMNITDNDEQDTNNQLSFTNNTFSDTSNNNIDNDNIIIINNNIIDNDDSEKVKSYIQKLQKKDMYSSVANGELTIEQLKEYLNAIDSYYKKT